MEKVFIWKPRKSCPSLRGCYGAYKLPEEEPLWLSVRSRPSLLNRILLVDTVRQELLSAEDAEQRLGGVKPPIFANEVKVPEGFALFAMYPLKTKIEDGDLVMRRPSLAPAAKQQDALHSLRKRGRVEGSGPTSHSPTEHQQQNNREDVLEWRKLLQEQTDKLSNECDRLPFHAITSARLLGTSNGSSSARPTSGSRSNKSGSMCSKRWTQVQNVFHGSGGVSWKQVSGFGLAAVVVPLNSSLDEQLLAKAPCSQIALFPLEGLIVHSEKITLESEVRDFLAEPVGKYDEVLRRQIQNLSQQGSRIVFVEHYPELHHGSKFVFDQRTSKIVDCLRLHFPSTPVTVLVSVASYFVSPGNPIQESFLPPRAAGLWDVFASELNGGVQVDVQRSLFVGLPTTEEIGRGECSRGSAGERRSAFGEEFAACCGVPFVPLEKFVENSDA